MNRSFPYKFHPQVVVRLPFYQHSNYSQSLVNVTKDAHFINAVYIGSRSLFDALKKTGFDVGRLTAKQRLSIKMYYNRMCYRPTPFGLFSSISVASWSSAGNCDIDHEPILHCLPDYKFSLRLAQHILKKEIAFGHTYRLNHTLYKMDGRLRYLRTIQDNSGIIKVIVDSIALNMQTSNILSFFKEKRTKENVVRFLMKEFKIDYDDGVSFVEDLIDEQVIFPDLQPNITGIDFTDRVREVIPNIKEAVSDVSVIKHGLEMISYNPLQKIFVDNKLFDSQINDLLYFNDNDKCSGYINMERKCIRGGADRRWQQNILDGLFALEKLICTHENENLNKFKEFFLRKFDARWIPLLVAIDPEAGIGYGLQSKAIVDSSLINEIGLEYPCSTDQQVHWSQAHSALLNKWRALDQSTDQFPTIEIDDSDFVIADEEHIEIKMPPSISVLFREMANSIYIEEAGGSSATSLIGRFTAFNNDIMTSAREIADIETRSNPQVIFAEIAYCPHPDVANVNRRANIREYEIPILTGSTLTEEKQIHLNDLWISVIDGEIVLWSKRLGKRIIPRLSSAFNYLTSDFPIFRFLCDLQYQGIRPSFTLDLPDMFPGLQFYPRVRYKNTVLHLATWHLNKSHFSKILLEPNPGTQLLLLKQTAEKMHWPKLISVNRDDNYIVINTTDDLELLFLLNLLNKSKGIVIKEFPFLAEKEGVDGDSIKSYVSQFMASLYFQGPIYEPIEPNINKVVFTKPVDRKFLPGSEWMYFKIYCHPSRANQLLVKSIMPLCKRWLSSGFLHQWFFVRYGDPGYHLRIRFNADPVNTGLLMKGVSKSIAAFVAAGVVSSFQTSIYEREIERYGPDIIEQLEGSFFGSSTLVCNFLHEIAQASINEFKFFEFTCASIDIILKALNYSLNDKIRLFTQAYSSMQREFKYTEKIKDQLNSKFRRFRDAKAFVTGQEILKKSKLNRAVDYFQYSHEELSQVSDNWPIERRDDLVIDIIHMHLNRLFTTDSRKNELVVYFCLWRHFMSEQGRQIKNRLKPLTAD